MDEPATYDDLKAALAVMVEESDSIADSTDHPPLWRGRRVFDQDKIRHGHDLRPSATRTPLGQVVVSVES